MSRFSKNPLSYLHISFFCRRTCLFREDEIMARFVFVDSVPSLIASSRRLLIVLVRNVVPPSHHSRLFWSFGDNCHLISAVVNVSLFNACCIQRLRFPLNWKNNYTFYLIYTDECLTSHQPKDINSDLTMFRTINTSGFFLYRCR